VEPRDEVERDVVRAKAGDRAALERVMRAVQGDVYNLALRFLWHPQDAEDATQEILIRVLTGLGGFRGESRFRTWVYRVACNALLVMRKRRMEEHAVGFDEFADDLARGLSDDPVRTESGVDEELLLEEVKIGCTMAMLLCLDRAHRLAYILGEIIELDHQEASRALGVTPAAYRKRLSRARERITSFLMSRCGLVNTANPCRCRRRVNTAVALGRVVPANLLFAGSREVARRFPEVLHDIRRLEAARRAGALYRSHPPGEPPAAFADWLRDRLSEWSRE
jgi:RNA polymerase sigma factor (sigma-70 family)